MTLVGATIFGASAYMLKDYPAPFVKDGIPAANLAVVVGDKAAGEDVIGAADVVQNLQTMAVVKSAGSSDSSKVTVTGDSFEIGSGSDLLELNETIGDVRETVSYPDLKALKGDTLRTDKGSTEYFQYISLNKSGTGFPPSGSAIYDEDEDNVVGDFLFWKDGKDIFEWRLDFGEGLESDIDDNGDLKDLEDKKINVLGQQYTIVDTDYDKGTKNLVLDMMAGSGQFILEEGSKVTVQLGSKTYEVEAVIISEVGEGSVVLKINGETTDELEDGDTDVLSDGTEIGITDIVASAKETQKSLVKGFLGAKKLEFEDITTDDSFSGNVELEEETIDDASVQMKGSETSANKTFRLDVIKYRELADGAKGDVFVPAGHGVRETLDEPQGMLGDFDIWYGGLMKTGSSMITLDAAGDDSYNLVFDSQDGQHYNVDLLTNKAGANGGFKWGNDDDDLWFEEGANVDDFIVSDDDMFVLSDASVASSDDTSNSHIMRWDNVDTSSRTLRFSDLAGGTKEITYDSTSFEGDLIVGGITYKVKYDSASGNISVDMNGDGSYTDRVELAAKGGALLVFGGDQALADGVGANASLSVITLKKEFDEAATDENLTARMQSRSNNEVGIAEISGDSPRYWSGLISHEENDELETAMSGYGVKVSFNNPSGSDESESADFDYPLAQRGAQVFLKAGVVSASQVGTGGGDVIQPIPIGANKLASEIADVAAFNAVLVGGPCANPVVALLLNNPEPCYESVAPNKAILKLIEHSNGNVALIVNGRDAINTRMGVRAIVTGKLAGVDAKEAEVSGTSLSEVMVKAV
jgi:hypothetical protein